MAYKGIAIIDDDNLFRHILKAQIAKIKSLDDVLLFENGEQAISYMDDALTKEDSLIPKLIFLDINMPVMNGWEFLDSFGKFKNEIKEQITIFIVTSSANDQDQQKANQYSDVTKYVVKPITSDILEKILSEFPNILDD